MAEARLAPLPPAEAIAQLRARGAALPTTFAWQDLWAEEHQAAFTVAKSAGFDILSDIHGALVEALERGETIQAFSKRLRPVLDAKGWWGRKEIADPLTGEVAERELGSPRRLRTIFDVNMRVSYARGHWARFERTKADRPYLRYVAILDGRTRPAHAARHNVTLPVDHPWWDRWAPPCGWGCRCSLDSLSQRDFDRMRSELVTEPPPDRLRRYQNRIGDTVEVPDGIDPGWAYNPGKGVEGRAAATAAKLVGKDPELAAAYAAQAEFPHGGLAAEFASWCEEIDRLRRRRGQIRVIGTLDADVLLALRSRGLSPEFGAITIRDDEVLHALRPDKTGREQALPRESFLRLPEHLGQARAVVFDRRHDNVLYLFSVPGEQRWGKVPVELDYTERGRPAQGSRISYKANSVRTSGLVEPQEFRSGAFYELLAGSLD